MAKTAWACPKCGIDAMGKHKRTLKLRACTDYAGTEAKRCSGFLCECDMDVESGHGDTLQDPCKNAQCYHCGWLGQWPPTPTKMKPWEKKALETGWKPPPGWAGTE